MSTEADMRPTVGFGIIGAGAMADGFAGDLRRVDDARLVAVASRRRSAADAFVGSHGGRAHDDRNALLDDSDVDVVYIATPNHRHAADALAAIEAGKAVLCEKPFALDAREATRVIDAARERGVFCMEAMWTRFIPAIDRAIKLVEAGEIGDVRTLHVDFSFRAPYDPSNRLFDPAQGGGALLDLGVYGVALSQWLLGRPKEIHAVATLGPSGVDEHFVAALHHEQGAVASITASLQSSGPNEAVIAGSNGTIRLPGPICAPRSLRIVEHRTAAASTSEEAGRVRTTLDRIDHLVRRGGRALGAGRRTERHRFSGSGYSLEAAEVVDCVHAGLVESRALPLDATRSAMETLDRIREAWRDGA